MLQKDMIQIMDYGKSMYGGWYANFFDEKKGEHGGCHAETLKELCNELDISKKELIRNVRRFDNLGNGLE